MAVETFLRSALIVEQDPSARLAWQMWPDTIVDSKTVNWANIEIIGRSEPIKAYSHSGPRTFAFVLSFIASADTADGGVPQHVVDSVDFLRSLAYPQSTASGILFPPPVVILLVGDYLNQRCVLRNVAATYRGPWVQGRGALKEDGSLGTRVTAFGPGTRGPSTGEVAYESLPLMADVSITLEEVNNSPFTSKAVRSGLDRVRTVTR